MFIDKTNFCNNALIPTRPVFAKADSGASKHFFRQNDIHVLRNVTNDTQGPTVMLPDMSTIKATKKGTIPLMGLSSKATTTHILPNLKSASLLSMGQLCDDGCKIELTKEKINISKKNRVILQGTRNQEDGLWDIPIQDKSKSEKINVIIKKNTAKKELVEFMHGACFSPTIRTFLQAIKNGNLKSWPGLTTDLVKQFLNDQPATALGHLKQERKNLQSTKLTEQEEDFTPMQQSTKTHETMCTIIPFQQKSKAYADLTGRFPFTSSRGNQYFAILYDYDSNLILAEVIPDRNAETITKAYMKMYNKLKKQGHSPKTFILDNEVSGYLINAFELENIQYQKVPPHVHRRNAAERAIQTWKAHFISGLASVNPMFPIAEWDRLVHQAVLTLNLLRNSRMNPKLSAWAYIFGDFDFNQCPLAPPGMRLIFHSKPDDRGTWDPRGKVGFYVGPAHHHYRCITAFNPDTIGKKSLRIRSHF